MTANQPVDLLTRMRINVLNENYTPVVGVLVDYLNDPATAQSAPPELYLLLGRAQRGLGNLTEALDAFNRFRQQYPTDPAASTAALEQALTYAEAGDTAQAVTTYTELVAMYPQSAEAPDALLRAAETERDSGNLEGAIALYDLLGQQYPNSEAAKQGLFEAGMIFRASDPARAADFFGRAGSSEGFVWQGKLLAQQGNNDAARAAWQQAQQIEPGTFFSLRGCELLTGRESLEASVAVQLQPIDPNADKASCRAVGGTDF